MAANLTMGGGLLKAGKDPITNVTCNDLFRDSKASSLPTLIGPRVIQFLNGCMNMSNLITPPSITFREDTAYDNAFMNCTKITRVCPLGATGSNGKYQKMYAGCTNIQLGTISWIGDHANARGIFLNCTSMSQIDAPIGGIQESIFTFPGDSWRDSFSGCKNLVGFRLPSGYVKYPKWRISIPNATDCKGMFFNTRMLQSAFSTNGVDTCIIDAPETTSIDQMFATTFPPRQSWKNLYLLTPKARDVGCAVQGAIKIGPGPDSAIILEMSASTTTSTDSQRQNPIFSIQLAATDSPEKYPDLDCRCNALLSLPLSYALCNGQFNKFVIRYCTIDLTVIESFQFNCLGNYVQFENVTFINPSNIKLSPHTGSPLLIYCYTCQGVDVLRKAASYPTHMINELG